MLSLTLNDALVVLSLERAPHYGNGVPRAGFKGVVKTLLCKVSEDRSCKPQSMAAPWGLQLSELTDINQIIIKKICDYKCDVYKGKTYSAMKK